MGFTIASKTDSPLARAEALQRLALLFFNLKDLWKAKESLVESLKLVKGSVNTHEKAIALLRSLRVVARIDQAMVPEVAEESIKTLNALQFNSNSRALMEVVWNTMPSFEALVQWDEQGGLNFVEKIQRVELRTVASFGAAKGILTASKTKEASPKKRATKS